MGDLIADLSNVTLQVGGGDLNLGERSCCFASGVLKRESSSSGLPIGGGVSRLSSRMRSGFGGGVRGEDGTRV